MFCVIKHIPSDTYVPYVSNPRDRSHYYSFLDGKDLTGKTSVTKNSLTFKNSFKYSSSEKALDFIDVLLNKKLREPFHELDHFTVEEYQFMPTEHIEVVIPPNWTVVEINLVKPNWHDKSTVRCRQCGAYIPPGFKYINVGGSNICAFCIEEFYGITQEAVHDCKNADIVDSIIAERFVKRL